MNITKITRLAFRNLFRNRRRTLITLLITSLGVTSLGVLSGYIVSNFRGIKEATIRHGFTGLGGTGHIQIMDERALSRQEDYPFEFGMDDYAGKLDALQGLPNVEFATPRIEFGGLISNGEKTFPFLGQGIFPEKEARLREKLREIAMEADNTSLQALRKNTRGVVLGKLLAEALRVKVGDTLILYSGTVHGALNALDVVVSGIITTGVKTADRYFLVTPLPLVQELVQTDKVNYIVLALKNDRLINATIDESRSVMNRGNNGGKIGIAKWQVISEYYNSVKGLYVIIFSFTGAIIFTIVVLSCTNTLLMTTMERIREIGTLRAMGISTKWTKLIFIVEGVLIGMASFVIGSIVQLAVTYGVNSAGIVMPSPPGTDNIVYQLRIDYITSWAPAVLVLIILSTVFASLITFRMVNRMSIVEALAHV